MAGRETKMKTQIWKMTAASLAVLTFAAACGGEPPPPAEPPPVAEVPAPAGPDYAALLAAPTRPVADAARDANRKPAEVLAFAKVMPGQTVFDLEAGGGFYTELLSLAVGPTGKVVMQQPKEFGDFYKEAIATRTADSRLANVTVSYTPFNALDTADASVDVVTWFQGPHELYCKAACGNAVMGEPAAVFTEISRVLKPGGYLVLMDHVAPQGTATTSGNDQHRIDKMQVMALATAAGFALEEESSILANPADDYTKGVFDAAVQGKTDQFLLRYKKP